MKLNFNVTSALQYEHAQFMNMMPDQITPRKIHIFRRNTPDYKKQKFLPNIHNQYILWMCLSGEGRLQIDGIEYQLFEDNAIFCFPGQPHMRIPLEGKCVDWLLIRFEADEKEWFSTFRNMTFHLCQRSREFLKQLMQAYSHARNDLHPMWNNECAGFLSLFLNSMRSDAVSPITPCETSGENRESIYVKKVASLIATGNCKGDAIQKAAGEFGITPDHLRSVFKRVTGRNITDLFKHLRYSRAVHFLTHSDLNITEIAEKLGFESVYSFSRFFKQMCGEPPKRYASRYRKN